MWCGYRLKAYCLWFLEGFGLRTSGFSIVLLGDWVAGFGLAVWLLDGLSAGFVFCFQVALRCC
jgi:hypothetical protein